MARKRKSPRRISRAPKTANLRTEFKPDYSYIIQDLRRIGVLAGSFIVILIALTFVLR